MEPGDSSPPPQPLWRGQTAPTEGAPAAEVPPAGPRRTWHPATWTVVGVALLVAFAVGITLVVRHLTPERLELADLEEGDCLASATLSRPSADLAALSPRVEDLEVVECTEPHVAEVFAVLEAAVGAETLAAAGAQCAAASPVPLPQVAQRALTVRPLAVELPIDAGARVVCIARDANGRSLTGRTMMRPPDNDAEE